MDEFAVGARHVDEFESRFTFPSCTPRYGNDARGLETYTNPKAHHRSHGNIHGTAN